MSSIITLPGENLIAVKQGSGQILVIDKMIFANVPGTDPEAAIDRSNQKPSADQIVHEYDIPAEYKGYVNPNQVVYSAVLDSNAGNYDFNWIGLYSSADDVVVAITTLPTISKFKTAGQVQGNHLTRNFMLEFSGAKESTGINVAADTWQIDFSARLADIDERNRITNREIYGDARFWCDGFKLVHSEGSYFLTAGVAYVKGVRIDLENPLPIAGEDLPKSVWLDVYLAPQGSTVVAKAVPVFGESFEDNLQDGIKHYYVKVAEIDGTGNVADFRNVAEIASNLIDYLVDQIEIHKADPDAHMALLTKLATGVPEIILPEKNAVDVGETPVFTWGQFVPIFINTALNAVQVQVGHASQDFTSPLFDSGPDSVAAAQNRFAMPSNYLLVSNMYKVRVRWRLNTGQWSPWSVVVLFTTKSEFNYVSRPEILSPTDGVTGIQERPELEAGAFSVVGDVADTHYSTQFMVKMGDTILHKSPEVLGGFTYQLPAGVLQPGNDYDAYCKETGQLLGESEWSDPASFHTAPAFIEGDAAILLVAWVLVLKATTTGTALEDMAELYSNSTDQDTGDADWAEFVVNAKIRGKITLLSGTKNNELVTPDLLKANDQVITEHGTATVESVTEHNTSTKIDFFEDGSGVDVWTFEDSLVSAGNRNIIESGGLIGYEDMKIGKGVILNDALATRFNPFQTSPNNTFTFSWFMPNIVDGNSSLNYSTTSQGDHMSYVRVYSSYVEWVTRFSGSSVNIPRPDSNEYPFIHLALVVTNNSVKRYINGNLIAEASVNFSSETVYIMGPESNTGSRYLRMDQLRWFNRVLTVDEIKQLMNEFGLIRYVKITELSDVPAKAHKIPKLVAATGDADSSFTANDFEELSIAEISIGTDTDPDSPDYIYMKSVRKAKPAFRSIAMGLKDLAKGIKALVAEVRIDTWKLGA